MAIQNLPQRKVKSLKAQQNHQGEIEVNLLKGKFINTSIHSYKNLTT